MNVVNDPAVINSLMNHPSLREALLLGDEAVDVAPLLSAGTGVFLGEPSGGFFYLRKADGVWEVHTQFLPEARGYSVLRKARESVAHMFMRTDCVEIITFVATGNKPALKLALAIGCKPVGEGTVHGHKGDILVFTIKDWARSLCQQY